MNNNKFRVILSNHDEEYIYAVDDNVKRLLEIIGRLVIAIFNVILCFVIYILYESIRIYLAQYFAVINNSKILIGIGNVLIPFFLFDEFINLFVFFIKKKKELFTARNQNGEFIQYKKVHFSVYKHLPKLFFLEIIPYEWSKRDTHIGSWYKTFHYDSYTDNNPYYEIGISETGAMIAKCPICGDVYEIYDNTIYASCPHCHSVNKIDLDDPFDNSQYSIIRRILFFIKGKEPLEISSLIRKGIYYLVERNNKGKQ